MREIIGEVVIKIGLLASYGWLVSFMMPGKICGLLRTSTLMGCLQCVAEGIIKIPYQW